MCDEVGMKRMQKKKLERSLEELKILHGREKADDAAADDDGEAQIVVKRLQSSRAQVRSRAVAPSPAIARHLVRRLLEAEPGSSTQFQVPRGHRNGHKLA